MGILAVNRIIGAHHCIKFINIITIYYRFGPHNISPGPKGNLAGISKFLIIDMSLCSIKI